MASNVSIVASLTLSYAAFKNDVKSASKAWKAAGQNMTSVGRDLSVAISAPLLLIAKQAVEVGSEFDLVRAKLQGLSQGSDISELEAQARQLGATTIFTAAEVINLQLSLKRLGQSNEEIQQLTPTILKFAQALDTDLAEAGEFVVQTLNRMDNTFSVFYDTASAAEFAAEGFAFAVSGSALTVDALRNSLNYVGAEANAAGLSFNETAAILAKLADNGYTGSRAGTQLRRVFTELTKEGRDVSKEFFDIVKSGVSFEEALNRVGVRAAGVFSALSGTGDAINQFSKEMSESKEVLNFFSESLDQTLYASSKKVESAFGELSITLADGLKPAIIFINEIIAQVFRGMSKMPKVIQYILIGIGGLLVSIPPLIFLAGSLTKAIGVLSASFAGLGRVMTFAVPGLAIVGAVLAGIAYALGNVSNVSEQAAQKIAEVREEINNLARSGDREGAVRVAIRENQIARDNLETLRAQSDEYERQLASAQDAQKVLNDTIYTSDRRRSFSSSPMGDLAQVTYNITDEEREQLRLAKERIAAAQNALAVNRESIATNQEVLNKTTAILANNEELVQSILNGDEANRQVLITVDSLLKTYQNLKNQVINIQQQFKNGGTANQIKELEELNKKIDELRAQLALLGVDVDNLDMDNDKVITSVSELVARYGELQKQLASIKAAETFDLDELKNVNTAISDIESILKMLGYDLTTLEGSEAWLRALEDAGKSAEDATKGLEEALASVRERIEDVGADDLTLQMAALDRELQKTIESLSLTPEQAEELSNAFDTLKVKTEEYYQKLKAEREAAEEQQYFSEMIAFTTMFTSGLLDMIDGTRSFGEVFADMAKKMLAQLLGLIAAWAVLNILSGGLPALKGGTGIGIKLGDFISGNFASSFGIPVAPGSNRGFAGVVSGSNLIIAEGRGITAFDRTYG